MIMSCNLHAHFINWLQSAAIFITFVAVLMHEWIHLSNCTAEFEIKMLKIASFFFKEEMCSGNFMQLFFHHHFPDIFTPRRHSMFMVNVYILMMSMLKNAWKWKGYARHCNVSVCLLWMPTSTFSSSSFVLLTLHYYTWCAYADMVVHMYNPFEVLFFVELHHKEKNNY